MVTAIFPVLALAATVAVICVSEFTANVQATPPMVTFVAPSKLVPVIVTAVPGGPMMGVKLFTAGITLNGYVLASVPDGVATEITPSVPVEGTTAVI